MQIDARGKNCPIPVIMAKKETDNGNARFTILVDNQTAVENLKRFAQTSGYDLLLKDQDFSSSSDFELEFVQSGNDLNASDSLPKDFISDNLISRDLILKNLNKASMVDHPKDSKNSWAIFVAKEGIGEGDSELGSTLLKMFFYTITQDENIPEYVLFMNSGVKVPAENEQIIEHLEELQNKGTKVLVCGACLGFYGLAEKLQTGIVSNMFDITEAMKQVAKVITL